MSDHDISKKVLLFLLGTAAGVAAGLLIAPRSGKETLRRLAFWREDLDENEGWENGPELKNGKEPAKSKSEKAQKVAGPDAHHAKGYNPAQETVGGVGNTFL